MVSKRQLSKIAVSEESSKTDLLSRCSGTKKSRISDERAPAQGGLENEGVFEELLRTSGIILKAGEGQNEIAVDQMAFQKKLRVALEKHPSYPGVVEQFISGLESHIKDRSQFKNCLLPCTPARTEGSRSGKCIFVLPFGQSWSELHVLYCLLKQGRRLTVPILDALSHLDLDAELLAEVRQSAMAIVPSVKLEDLPVVVKFILQNVRAADAVEVISDLRKSLDLSSCVLPLQMQVSQRKLKSQAQASSSMSQMTTSQNCVKVLFDVIKLAVRFQKDVSEAWIKVRCTITINGCFFLKVLDLIVLLLIHSTNSKNRKQTEKVLRSKIRLGCMPEQLMQNAFQDHSMVIKDFFPSILSLAQTFLHSAHPAVVSFGSCMYKQAFAAFDSYCQQEVVCALVTHVCSGNETELDVSLDVLTDLVILHTSLLMRYATFVKSILDSMQKLNPCQIRKLFYILSMLAFSQRQEGSYIQDDMHMVIRKWLSSSVPNHKQMGIIGAVTMMGSLCLFTLLILQTALSLQLSTLLDLVGYCCEQTPELLALYYDELANLIEKQKGNLDLHLSVFSCSSFLFPVKSLYNLDEDETQGAIAINLLPLVSQSEPGRVADEMSSPRKRAVSPLCLSPCFRLLRLYTGEQNNGSLEEIDALLGCPLYLTDLEVEGKLDSLSKQEREFLCSLLFYALNWFREVVNAFCQQQDAEMKGKVLTRLQNITELQNVLGKCLAATPGYVPPPATFDSEAPEGVPSINAGGPVRKGSGKEIVQLGPAELCFLLDDMCWKLEHVLTPGSTRRVPFLKERGNKDAGFSHLCQRSPKEVAVCVVKLLKPLCNHMENMHNYFQTILPNQGVVNESGLNTQEYQLMSSCYHQLLLTFRLLFAWNGFSQHENSTLLRSALQVLADRLKPGETEFLPLEELISESFQYLLNFQQSIPSFQCAFVLTQLLMAISEKPMTGWKREKMASLAKQFLCQSWVKPGGDQEKGSHFNSALHTLLCVYLEHTDNILKAVEEISSVGVPELINSAKDGRSATYPTLSRQTFPVFFRVMMAQLESSVKSIPAGKPSDSSEVQLEKLLKWNIAVRNFHVLINLVKVRIYSDDGYGRLFVEAFLKLAMPLLDHSFKKHRDDVQSLLKTLQLSTRQLHHMCGHSKIHQDLSLTNHVPLLKKSLEQFVYRVKAMLAFNHCQEAFWVGILKNRDLQGEEILSQASAAPEEDSAEGSEEDLADSTAEVGLSTAPRRP
uniref:FA complementation group D2 n=1 Tax=Pavo cristatus TaxID=9049 RepID=A0A8C9FAT9_PAVCR